MPARARAIRRQAGELVAFEADAAARHRHQAHQAFEQRRLADSVAAEQRRTRAMRQLEAHVAQRLAAAVVLVEIVA